MISLSSEFFVADKTYFSGYRFLGGIIFFIYNISLLYIRAKTRISGENLLYY